jgi:hypothetical protein
VWVLFLLLPKELVPLVIVTQRYYYLKSSRTSDFTRAGYVPVQSALPIDVHNRVSDFGGERWWNKRKGVEQQAGYLESQLLEEPSVLAGLVPLLKLLPHRVAGLLFLQGILKAKWKL